jgi:hypothetical protein
MDAKQLINSNLGKRMTAFAWAGWLIKESTDQRQQLLIVIMAVAYMVCQTFSDWTKDDSLVETPVP